jgi:photosystem II stability/assembly factor-like uncharacterized protein
MVYALAASPAFERDGLCFAACSTGLSRSDDGGRTWGNALVSLELEAPLPTAAVVMLPHFETDQGVFAGVAGGILRSADGGHSWQVVILPAPPPFVSTLVASPDFARDGTLLAGTLEDGVFRSGDRGLHWEAWNFGLLDLSVLCLGISPDSGVFQSTNGGRAWREVEFPSEWAPVLSLALSPDYSGDGTLFAGTETCGLFASRDGGSSWQQLGEERLTSAVNSILLGPEFPAKGDMLVLHEDALLVSRDGGERWSEWQMTAPTVPGVAAVAAPLGLDPGAPLLVGSVEGDMMRV